MSDERPFSAASFNQYLSEERLMGSHCVACGEQFLPPRAICPACRADRMEWVEFSGEGKLAAYTAIYIAPTLMLEEGYGRDRPYTAGVVETAEGPKISARILGAGADDAEGIEIGTPLRVAFEKRGEGDQARTYLAFRV